MDLTILKKKLSTFRTETGKLMDVSDELLYELLMAWEQWTGPAIGFYTALGMTHRRLAKLIGKAKRLKREGAFPAAEFKEVKITGDGPAGPLAPCMGIEIAWDNGKIIRFQQVDSLVDFLKKVA